MFKNNHFQPHWGEFRVFGTGLTTDLPITEAAPDSATLESIEGKLVDINWADYKLRYTTGKCFAIMERRISLNGIKTDAQYLQSVRPTHLKDPPIRRGLPAEVRIYGPDSYLDFEGLGVASVDNNVVTSGTGALSAGTTRHSELSCIKGGLYLAQTGDLVFALFEISLTPFVAGNLRVRVRTVSPYIK